MARDIKDDIKKLARETEVKVAEALLRWKHRREGTETPDRQSLDQKSRLITDKANRILSKKGKSLWDEIKKAYQEGLKKED